MAKQFSRPLSVRVYAQYLLSNGGDCTGFLSPLIDIVDIGTSAEYGQQQSTTDFTALGVRLGGVINAALAGGNAGNTLKITLAYSIIDI